MNRLWVRLSLAFGLVVLVAVVLAALLMNRQIDSGFRRYVAYSQVEGNFVESLARYYIQSGSWENLDTFYTSTRGQGQGRRRGAPRHILADAEGNVVYVEVGANAPAKLTARDLANAVPIETDDDVVGYLLLDSRRQDQLTVAEQTFLDQISRSLYLAGLIAVVLGLALGLIIARGLSSPLSRLAAAARSISRGDLDQRVQISSSQEVVDLSEAFNEMADGLQHAETLRRNMVADIAHELRTPLTIIQGNLRAILDDIYPMEKSEIATIYDESLVLSRLVGDLRELSQIEAGQLSLNVGPTSLGTIIEGITEVVSEVARSNDVTIDTSIEADLPLVMADPDRLRQILYNLLSNALKYTPTGGRIEVKALVSKPVIRIPFVRVSISDTGAGIPAEDLPYVFDRFWRSDRSRSREHGGSGLGLAIARQLVEAQGGQIGVESKLSQGSTFWFTLPVSA